MYVYFYMFGLVVGVYEGDDMFIEEVFGVVDFVCGEFFMMKYNFCIVSIIKLFVVVVLLQLIDEGVLLFDDLVSCYMCGVFNGDWIMLWMLV